MFSRWKHHTKTEQRKFSINPFEKNQKSGIGSPFEIKKKKNDKMETQDWWHSSGYANLTNFEYPTVHSLDSADAFDTKKYFT